MLRYKKFLPYADPETFDPSVSIAMGGLVLSLSDLKDRDLTLRKRTITYG